MFLKLQDSWVTACFTYGSAFVDLMPTAKTDHMTNFRFHLILFKLLFRWVITINRLERGIVFLISRDFHWCLLVTWDNIRPVDIIPVLPVGGYVDIAYGLDASDFAIGKWVNGSARICGIWATGQYVYYLIRGSCEKGRWPIDGDRSPWDVETRKGWETFKKNKKNRYIIK